MKDYKYKSGNEGKHHPNMKHRGYWQQDSREAYVNDKRHALQRAWMKKQRA